MVNQLSAFVCVTILVLTSISLSGCPQAETPTNSDTQAQTQPVSAPAADQSVETPSPLAADKKEYKCLCTKCNHSWTSSTKPTECPKCQSKQIVYN